MFAPTDPSGGMSFVQVLLSIPPQYSVADLRTRFWYFVSDAATVPLSLLALSFGLHNTSLRTLLVSSVLGAQSDMVSDSLYKVCLWLCMSYLRLYSYVCTTYLF